MNKIIKILSIILIAIMLVMITTQTFAASTIITTIEANDSIDTTNSNGLAKTAGQVVAFIRTLAVISGVVILTALGIKFMMGSAEEKAEYKKSLMPLVIGIVVVMASTQIATMIFNIITG